MTEIFSCSKIKSILPDYFDGELSHEEKEMIKIHIEQCPECKKEFDDLCGLSECIKNYSEKDINESGIAGIVSARLDKCDRVKEDLSAFIDGELSKERTKQVSEHILVCEYCRKDYEDLKETNNALKNYFARSTENIKTSELTGKSVLRRVEIYQKRRKIIYSAAAIALLALATYFSLNIFTSPENIHEVKYVPDEGYVESQGDIFPIPEKP